MGSSSFGKPLTRARAPFRDFGGGLNNVTHDPSRGVDSLKSIELIETSSCSTSTSTTAWVPARRPETETPVPIVHGGTAGAGEKDRQEVITVPPYSSRPFFWRHATSERPLLRLCIIHDQRPLSVSRRPAFLPHGEEEAHPIRDIFNESVTSSSSSTTAAVSEEERRRREKGKEKELDPILTPPSHQLYDRPAQSGVFAFPPTEDAERFGGEPPAHNLGMPQLAFALPYLGGWERHPESARPNLLQSGWSKPFSIDPVGTDFRVQFYAKDIDMDNVRHPSSPPFSRTDPYTDHYAV